MLIVLLPLLFGIVFAANLTQQLVSTASQFERLKQSQEVLLKLNNMIITIARSGLLFSSLLYTPQTESRLKAAQNIEKFFLHPGYLGDVKLDGFSEFKELFADAEAARTLFMKMIADSKRSTVIGTNVVYTNAYKPEAVMSVLTFNSLVDRIKAATVRLDNEEPAAIKNMFMQVVLLLIVGFAISCALSFLIAYIFTVDIVRRLATISGNALLVAADKELPPPLVGTDEIAELDRTLHKTDLQLKAFRKKERAILNNTADVVASLDRRLRFSLVGESASRLWGYSTDDLLGRSLLTILSEHSASRVAEEFESIAKSDAIEEVATIVKCCDGSLKDFLWTVNWSADGQEFVCVAHDITELRKIERLKQAFFSMVSHDLRTPLASVNINISNMTSGVCGPLPEGGARLLSSASSNMQRLTSLVNDLLDLDKLDSERLILDVECISLRDVCEASIEALESMASSAGVELVAPHSDAAVMADERRLVQVVTNLISNAIKFSPRDGKVRVEILRKGDQVEIAVSDQGPGISIESQAGLFEKYKQGPSPASSIVKGTGLGLAIVKSIMKAHDGEVGVESEMGKGSTFWIRMKEFVD
ncbi:MAG TPA: PAS domain S-box protein [Candidatus Melainabacteria bacterium]|nr:PAS domain S-box protein [Candidatus Melainabacteria bacterium]